MNQPSYIRLNGKKTSLVIDCSQGLPAILYFGKRLSDQTDNASLALTSLRQETVGGEKREAPVSLHPETGRGFPGTSGIEMHSDGSNWASVCVITDIKQTDTNAVITSVDNNCGIELTHTISLHTSSDLISFKVNLKNKGQKNLTVDRCVSATIPISPQLSKAKGFEGRWANEFSLQDIDLGLGSYVRENKRGRTSHDSFPGLLVHTPSTNQQQGEVIALHLAWSGNHRINLENIAYGKRFVQMGDLFFPGEIQLKHNESYESPELLATYSDQGFNGSSQNFHTFYREALAAPQTKTKARPIHYNTWEALYFDHSIDILFDLADRAAEVGAERFVLDDGWFNGRRSDKAGLGDWYVDKTIYPNGLQPLIDKVKSNGMEFGLWFEPEMVNPDSDLYRNHPDWVLSASPNETVEFRNQLVLNLTLPEVQTYLFERLDSLLSEYDISYIKWDMNRDLNQPGSQHSSQANNQPLTSAQNKSLYALLQRVRQAHPSVEIESCASGGARADLGILRHTDRVWTSDSNDALDRLSIQRGFSYFFPAELMGAHIGPRDCHITGRQFLMSTRAGVSFSGSLGMEMDLREITDKEKSELQMITSFYKEKRNILHTGDHYRLDSSDDYLIHGTVSKDKTQAVYTCAMLKSHIANLPERLFFAGLAPEKMYNVKLAWPSVVPNNIRHYNDFYNHFEATGELLINAGIQLPLADPNTVLIFSVEKK